MVPGALSHGLTRRHFHPLCVKEELISSDDMSVFTIGLMEAAGVTEAGIEKELINVVEAGYARP